MNSSEKTTRERIFSRLESALKQGQFNFPEPEKHYTPEPDLNGRIELLKKNMEAVRTQVHVIQKEELAVTLNSIIKDKDIKSLVYSPETEPGQIIENSEKPESLKLIKYEKDIEDFKSTLFETNAGLTTALGAVADTGALILWPDEKEPRLMSLVPAIHIAVLKAETIQTCFLQVIETNKWSDNMPTNALLISGPSKTADIELTLAFGVHGPKELIVIIVR